MFDLPRDYFQTLPKPPGLRVPVDGDRHRLRELGISIQAGLRGVRDTGRIDCLAEVCRNFPVSDVLAFTYRRNALLRDRDFLALYRAGSLPNLTSAGLAALRALPPGTVGHEYARDIEARGFDDHFLAYLLPPDNPNRFLNVFINLTHDLRHFILGYPGGPIVGEMQNAAFLWAQTHTVDAALVLVALSMTTLIHEPRELLHRARHMAAARRHGHRAHNVFTVRWQPLLALPLEEARARLRICVEPACPACQARPDASAGYHARRSQRGA